MPKSPHEEEIKKAEENFPKLEMEKTLLPDSAEKPSKIEDQHSTERRPSTLINLGNSSRGEKSPGSGSFSPSRYGLELVKHASSIMCIF